MTQENVNVLDIGCGYGYSTYLMQIVLELKIAKKNLKCIPKVYGVDIYKSFVDWASWMKHDIKTKLNSPEFHCVNLLDDELSIWNFDFIHSGVAFE